MPPHRVQRSTPATSSCRLAADARGDDDADAPPDVLAQVQAEAAATWRSPSDTKPTVRGADRLRAWHEGFSLHAGVVIADHDRDALERLCRYGARPAFARLEPWRGEAATRWIAKLMGKKTIGVIEGGVTQPARDEPA